MEALIGESAEVSRFLYATGFSGHGFLMGPAVGEVVRLLLHRQPPVDVMGRSVARLRTDAPSPACAPTPRPEASVV